VKGSRIEGRWYGLRERGPERTLRGEIEQKGEGISTACGKKATIRSKPSGERVESGGLQGRGRLVRVQEISIHGGKMEQGRLKSRNSTGGKLDLPL